MVKTEVEEQPSHVMEDYITRKRTPKDSAPSETTTPVPSELEQTTAAPVAAAEVETTAAQDPEQQQSFVQRIQRQRRRAIASAPFGIAGNYEAGVRLLESRRFRQVPIKFEEKPSQEVLDRVIAAGYRWNANDYMWVRPIEANSAMTTRIETERLHQEVRGMIREANRGCRPVLYLSDSECRSLHIPRAELWRVVRFEAKEAGWISWLHARAWRCKGAFELPPTLLGVLIRTAKEARKLQEEITNEPDEFKVKPSCIIPLYIVCQGLPGL